MKDFLSKLIKYLLHLVIAVYILSIPWQGQTLYSHAKSILVDNRIVGLLGDHCVALYDQLTDRIRLTLLETTHKDKTLD